MFATLEQLPPDPILGLGAAFREDPSPDKVDLSVGVYKDRAGNTPVMAVVKEAEQALIASQATKVYLPAAGSPGFREAIFKLVMGEQAADLRSRTAVLQAAGGCGALRLGAELVQRAQPGATLLLGDPTWPNHGPLLSGGGLQLLRHPYYDPATRSVVLQPVLDALSVASPGTLVLLQASCHNPTGVDPTREQWEQILAVIAARRLVPFFDIAYQGLGDDPDTDAWPIREAARQVPEMLVAVSSSKNFGLYRERTGALLVLAEDRDRASAIESHANKAARAMYSMPPAHGALIVERILTDPQRETAWRSELAGMCTHIRGLRSKLAEGIMAARPGYDASWITRQRGMFSLLGIARDDVNTLREQHHIYMGYDSRANLAGLNEDNLPRVAELVAPLLPGN
ncbi:MAG: aromatic amino acid transaminase [Steroidobacteraceae bacterium]